LRYNPNETALFDIFMRRLTVTDNPFLAGIEHQGELKASHKFIIEALEENFGAVPEEVQRLVRRITDEARLRILGRKAVRSASLEAFLSEIDEVASSPGG
jgi:hypothetical protein